MKLHCPTTEDRLEEVKRKKLWFAWYPVRITDTSECRWLEYVVRSYPDAYPLRGMSRILGGHPIKKDEPKYEAVENYFEFGKNNVR